jgi:TolA-binding protein
LTLAVALTGLSTPAFAQEFPSPPKVHAERLTFDPKTEQWVVMATPIPGSENGDLDLARQAMARTDYRHALEMVKDWIKKYGPGAARYPEALYVEATAQLELSDYRSAHDNFQKLLNEYPASEFSERALSAEFRIAEQYLAGKKRKVQTASAVLCYSRMLFFQCYPTFRRFDCKVFLTEALRYFGGAAARTMIDNTHVVVLRGSGRDMVPVPEMAAFGERFGFQFVAHAIGNANRSARVERPFHFIENNFLAGRAFSSWEDLNQRAREWCDKVNSTYKKHIRAVPRELFAVERLHLKPLPAWIPEVYRLQQRLVDIEGYVALNSNRYSVPVEWIGRRVEVRETKDKIEIQLDARRLATHRRIAEAEHQRVMLAEHRPPRGHREARPDPHPEEQAIVTAAPELADYVVGLKQRSRKVVTLALRQLLRFVREYPREPLVGAVEEAARYGLYDLDRLERMILRRVTREYFLLDEGPNDD